LAYETGVTNTVDPLGGSYFIDALTRTMRHEARGYFDRIESVGGMISAIEAGFFRSEIAEAAFAYQRDVDAKRKLIVGVNAFVEADEKPMETHTVDDPVERDQIDTLRATRSRVDAGELRRCLDEVRRAADRSQNLVGPLLQAALARASVGEIMSALADVFGPYEPRSE
jgi:methylmalonyl-CoA mutase N-terminal domain/subunit